MNIGEKGLLLAFNGEESSLPAVDYGVWLAEQLRVPVTLLGIVENKSRRKDVEKVIGSSSTRLQAAGISYHTKTLHGKSAEIIWQLAEAGHFLTIFGPFDIPVLRRWLRGRSFRRIFKEIKTPVLYVKQAHLQLRKMLVCMGGLGYAMNAARWALFLAQRFNASITILHVVEPITYNYPIAQVIQDQWKLILETNTPQGQNLREAIKYANDMGVSTAFQVRKGDIVHEIIKEVQANDYDLIVMGSPYSSTHLRHLFMPNTTAEIAEIVSCSVLTVGVRQDSIFDDFDATR